MSEIEIESDVAIIGGGVSGALTAYHVLHLAPAARVVVIDPRPKIGLGLAYSTPSLRHLLNVPAGKISALPDEPDHFLNWLRSNHDPKSTAESFAPRAVFGRYIQELLTGTVGVQHIAADAIACRPGADGALLTLDDGRPVRARRVVLATGNFDPAPLPGVADAAIASGAYRHNAWDAATYDALDAHAPVILIGTGLTAVDVLLRLRELGHRGEITAVSRHGVFPHRHEAHPTLDRPAIAPGTEPTCVAYVKAVKQAIEAGTPWRSVIDSLRATTNDLWVSLSLPEQKRFRRHLQRRWDVVRHRMAPTIADALDAELAAKTLQIRHGHLSGVDANADGTATVTLTGRGGRQRLVATRVINCTGPGMNYRKVNSPLLDGLFDAGMITPGPHGTGLKTDASGAVVNSGGVASKMMFSVGPSRLGTLLESIAVPELREQAVQVARLVIA